MRQFRRVLSDGADFIFYFFLFLTFLKDSFGACLLLLCPLFPLPLRRLLARLFSVAALPSADALRPAPAVAALLDASSSEDSHRGPYQQAGIGDLPKHT